MAILTEVLLRTIVSIFTPFRCVLGANAKVSGDLTELFKEYADERQEEGASNYTIQKELRTLRQALRALGRTWKRGYMPDLVPRHRSFDRLSVEDRYRVVHDDFRRTCSVDSRKSAGAGLGRGPRSTYQNFWQ